MGNFYTNVTVVDTDKASVAAVMQGLGRESYVLTSDSDTIVYDRQSDDQDTEILGALADHLSSELETTTFAVLNHDDDELWFQLFHRGELMSEYANRGGPTTSIAPLHRLLRSTGTWLQVWWTLKRPFLFQVSRHLRLVEVLGLPLASVAAGFKYVERGDLPPGVSNEELDRIGPGAQED